MKTTKAQKHNTDNLKDEQHGPHQKLGVNRGAHEGKVIPASYKTPSRRSLCQKLLNFLN